ncbi:hypothetical protein [Actinoalloteichus caeruleus]|uniref:Uncharacterized protein n=1 Tax=Actinoalloteichus caeruleus DSM 43889 TaxID=1120930 RepID=A0ABT1JFQ0_ACTCY|nr:hypothetical protein [Actinoalloteichus caeruleus]MCP2331320.1 hypothetical protein [Actinoalloteichus caeruleus DSM 43889]
MSETDVPPPRLRSRRARVLAGVGLVVAFALIGALVAVHDGGRLRELLELPAPWLIALAAAFGCTTWVRSRAWRKMRRDDERMRGREEVIRRNAGEAGR